jgi:integrase
MHPQPKPSPSIGNVTGHVALVKRKRDDKWYLRYRLADGRKVQKCLGLAWQKSGRPPAGYYTERTAEEALEAVLTDARRGTLAGATRTGATFADAAAEYLRYVEDVKQIDPATVADYKGVVNGYLLDVFGELAIEAVTPDEVETYKEKLISEGKLSNRTIVRHLTVLHGIFKRAQRKWKGLPPNPASADMVERPKVVYSGEFDTFDRDELDRLDVAAESPQDAALYRTAAFTGLRQGELLALRWKCVDFVGGLMHVRRNFTDGREKVPKGKRVRSVPMMPEVIDTLAALKDREHFTGDDDLVFCSEVGDHLDHFKLRKRFYAALDTAGLRRIRFHDLRHCFGSTIITAPEITPADVQAYMGHQHFSTTQRYLHHRPRPAHAAAFARAFERRGEEVPVPEAATAKR